MSRLLKTHTAPVAASTPSQLQTVPSNIAQTPCAIDCWHTSFLTAQLKMARQSTALIAALLLQTATAIRPSDHRSSAIARRDAFKVALPPAAAALLAAPPAWARYDDYKDGPRGLKYIVTKPGTDATPQRGQSVKAEYTLTLDGFSEDGGRVVDSSKGFLKGPFAFYAGTGGVIKGWDLVRRRVSRAFLFARTSTHAGEARA